MIESRPDAAMVDQSMGRLTSEVDDIFASHRALTQGFGFGGLSDFGDFGNFGNSMFGNILKQQQAMMESVQKQFDQAGMNPSRGKNFIQMQSSSYVMTRGPDGKPKASYTSSGRSIENGPDGQRAAGFRHASNSNNASVTQRHYKDTRGVEGRSYKKALGDRSREVWVHRDNGKEDRLDKLHGMTKEELANFDSQWSQQIRDGPRVDSLRGLPGPSRARSSFPGHQVMSRR
jgi:hypothetical protein